ncbi:hypothetical protein HZQ12_10340 [Elizabethkingia anophelis]|uniref:hypothetical protein n=1 Tax=Elizabethkingia anophelis TaxID=1117645 RepID=UPI0021A8B60B|nr:hypothetical protein [Elizabethkingia anophelis]MCT3977301.1 hypothetical protein [Elizabethkingia anophelis]MCT4040821.1 hypothetical protein [Elizabethkingia anophelis]
MDPFTMMMLLNTEGGTGGSGASSTAQSTGGSGGLVNNITGGLLDGLMSGITKFIGCLGKQAWNTDVYNQALSAIDHAIDGIKTNADAERTLNDFSAIIVSMPAHRDSMRNACTKENMNLYIDYTKSAKARLLTKFDVQEAGTGWWDAEGRYPHGEKKGNITLLRVIGVKGSTTPDLPINGGVDQNVYNPVQNAITYTQDEVDQMIRNASLTNNLSASDLTSLMQLKTQLQNNPNCRGGFKDGKPYLDCSLTNDHTQNMIQVAGLALTAVGLVYMMTKKKK